MVTSLIDNNMLKNFLAWQKTTLKRNNKYLVGGLVSKQSTFFLICCNNHLRSDVKNPFNIFSINCTR